MSLLRVDTTTWRVWVLRRRLHHGPVGVALGIAGLLLAAHDRRDWRVWFTRDRLP